MSETILDLIQSAEKEIRRDTEDLSRLKQRYPGYDFVRITAGGASPIIKESRPVLQTAVLALINGSSFREWTSRSVLNELTASGQVSFPTDAAGMNAVGLVLIALAETGEITRTHEGRGRDPHRYTPKNPSSEPIAAAS